MKKDLLTYGLTSLVAAGIAVSYYNKLTFDEVAKQEQSVVVQQQTVAQTSPYGKWVDHDVVGCLRKYVDKNNSCFVSLPVILYQDEILTICADGHLINYVRPVQDITSLQLGLYSQMKNSDPQKVTVTFKESGFTISKNNCFEGYVYDAKIKKEILRISNDVYEDTNCDGMVDVSTTHTGALEMALFEYAVDDELFMKWKDENCVALVKRTYNDMINRIKCVAYEQHNSICQKQ